MAHDLVQHSHTLWLFVAPVPSRPTSASLSKTPVVQTSAWGTLAHSDLPPHSQSHYRMWQDQKLCSLWHEVQSYTQFSPSPTSQAWRGPKGGDSYFLVAQEPFREKAQVRPSLAGGWWLVASGWWLVAGGCG